MNTNKPIGIVIADDHVIMRDGLRVLVESDQELKLLAEAADGKQLVAMVRKHRPDVVITDLTMPVMDGIEAIKIMTAEGTDRILVYTMHHSTGMVLEALNAGALGCVVKNASRTEIIEGIKAVYEHRGYCCRATMNMIAGQVFQHLNNTKDRNQKELFTERDKEIIRLICKSKSSKAIAQALYMSSRTVEGVRSRIWKKIHAKSQVDLIIYAITHNIYQVDKDENFDRYR